MRDLDFIEACHSRELDDRIWGMTLAHALGQILPAAGGVMAASYRVSATTGGSFVQIVGDTRYTDLAADALHTLPYMAALNAAPQRDAFLAESFGVSSPAAVLASEVSPGHQAVLRRNLPWRELHMLGLFATLDGTHGLALAAGGPEALTFSPRRRSQLLRLCEHAATAYRVRLFRAQSRAASESMADAALSPDGRLLHRSPAASDPELAAQFVDAVRQMDRTRCRRKKRSPDEAADMWQALVAGQYTLVESFERDGRRVILAVRCRSAAPRLTRRESAVAREAAEGLSNKQIAERLGMAPSTVAVHLGATMRKLRCPNRRALTRWLPEAVPGEQRF